MLPPFAMADSAERRARLKRLLLVLGCAVLVPIIPFVLIGELPGERWLNAQGQDATTLGLVGAGLLAADVILPIPSSILGALLGGRLGFALGFTSAFAGLCLGSAVGYALGRLLPERHVRDVAGELPKAPAFAIVLLSRPVPVFAEAISLASGATRVPLASFALASAIGNALYAAAMAANGAALLPDGLAGPGLVLPMLVPVASWLIWKRMRT